MNDKRESICALCGCDIVNAMLDYSIFIASEQHPVCGRCYLLTKIMEVLDGNDRRSGLQITQ